MKFYKYVIERRGRIIVSAISVPPVKWKSPLNAFEDAFKHEQKVTGMIDDIANLAAAEKDHATANALKWFIDEQVEEELSTDAIVQKLKMIGTNTGGLYMLDRELSQRKTK
jgi:ferritin